MAAKEVVVSKLPPCDIHPGRTATYDFRSTMGPWMHGCPQCFRAYGRGLGVGVGQKLVLRTDRRA